MDACWPRLLTWIEHSFQALNAYDPGEKRNNSLNLVLSSDLMASPALFMQHLPSLSAERSGGLGREGPIETGKRRKTALVDAFFAGFADRP